MEDIVERGYVIVGSPDEVVEQLREVADNLNVGHLMLLLQYGNMSKELAKYNTKLFAEQVMPKLQPDVLRVGGQLVAEADGEGRSARRCRRSGRRAGGGVGANVEVIRRREASACRRSCPPT